MTVKLIVNIILLLVTAGVYASDFELCIHAKVYSGMTAYILESDQEGSKLNRMGYRVFGDLITGHASLEVLRNKKSFRRYGYWPDDNLQINFEGDVNTDNILFENSELMKLGTHTVRMKAATLCYPIGFGQLEVLEQKAIGFSETYGDWTNWNNCVDFATQLFTETTGIGLSPIVPTPRLLVRAIESKAGHQVLE